MTGLTTGSLRAGIANVAPFMAASAAELNAADGKLGDGDLGITMDRGMAALLAMSDDLPDDVGMALFACAREFTKVSGSSYGTLLATGLMSAAKSCKGNAEVPWAGISGLFSGALDAMMARGKGSLGDKTVLDTLEAMRGATEGLQEALEILAACEVAISDTMDVYHEKTSKLGRARMYGDKSVGLDDPGMLALRRVVDGLSAGADF